MNAKGSVKVIRTDVIRRDALSSGLSGEPDEMANAGLEAVEIRQLEANATEPKATVRPAKPESDSASEEQTLDMRNCGEEPCELKSRQAHRSSPSLPDSGPPRRRVTLLSRLGTSDRLCSLRCLTSGDQRGWSSCDYRSLQTSFRDARQGRSDG